jgi:hypothetical protein
MKKLIYISTLFSLLLSNTGCKKDKTPEWSVISALRNGEEWEMPARAFINKTETDNFSIQVPYYDEITDYFESMTISNLPMDNKYISLFKSTENESILAKYYLLAGSDVILDWYDIVDSPDNYINITYFDFKNMEVSGTFNLSFANVSPNREELPDTIRFTNGQFRLKIKEVE